jgi:anion-transporting  ArsA/GET3 family ATPase
MAWYLRGGMEPIRVIVAMQQEHMQTIWQKFDGSVRAVVPLFEAEIRGVPMLQRLGGAMFG